MQKVDPKKRLGQHFLKDKSICERIANLYASQERHAWLKLVQEWER
jgi:16S rRNA A1518/A1519 N6-dimethyltransferase RsmA/KsgA/DIM1 with predicted DNA glycosylase/AP lyase activity